MQQISLIDEQFATNHCQLKKTCPILVPKAFFNLLRYFRINDPYRLLVILILLLLMALPVFIDGPGMTFPELKSIVLGQKVREGNTPYTAIVDSTAPLTNWFYAASHFLFGDSLIARHIFGFFLIFVQICLLGIIFIDKKVFPDSTYIPPLIFGILFMFSFDTLTLSGELAGAVFLLLAINNLFKELEFKEQRNEYVFNAGLCIGIASLFAFSFAVYAFAALIILGLYSRVTTSKFLLVIVGLLLPHLLLIAIYYLNDGMQELWTYYYLPNLKGGDSYSGFSSLLLLMAVPLGLLVVSLVLLTRDSRFTKYQSQLVQAMFFWMAFGVIQVWVSDELRPQSLITLFPPIAFYLSHMLLIIRRRKFAEIAFWILCLGTFGGSLFARYNSIESNYGELLVPSGQAKPEVDRKRILVLGPQLELYRHNELATPFFDWELSKEIFESPEFYENQLTVYHGLSSDRPDVILDPANLLAPFLKRMPEISKEYARTSSGYRRISN
jgi:hypothetical protein